ncbi:hypothetical protein C7974DRAFT_373411 [Boeremia exigua]|uniref:uncharacterized protein n=1 Tax=Boeremia exigua TaxID=749465 RepID=UPI001E8DBDE1|nr:uncharacterized protein C7974DRAFT_373411 [Boeremia exigua]KAH6639137.1 hypothetical protein C7974DRAFT_373411 [Boeremia exigua]
MSSHVFSEFADQEITVGNQAFRVCKSILMDSSNVFKAMLKPGRFAEGCGGPVRLPEDDPASFKLVMDIVHNNYNKIPQTITSSELASLLELVDKYDLVSHIRNNTISLRCIEHFSRSVFQVNNGADVFLAAKAAHVFGLAARREQLLWAAAMLCYEWDEKFLEEDETEDEQMSEGNEETGTNEETYQNGPILKYNGQPVAGCGFEETLKARRVQLIQALRAITDGAVNAAAQSCCCEERCDDDGCAMDYMGDFIDNMKQAGLLPDATDADYVHGRPFDYYKALMDSEEEERWCQCEESFCICPMPVWLRGCKFQEKAMAVLQRTVGEAFLGWFNDSW